MLDPPPLPARLTRTADVVAIGSVAWLAAAVGMLVAHLTAGHPLGLWFVICLVGTGLGGVGYAIFTWQRAAARRGSRTAQVGLE